MNYYVLTLFPEMIWQGFNTSITKRALEKELLSLTTINIRDFSENKHMKVDDYPYGGGAGMVMQPGPVYGAYESAVNRIHKTQSEESSKASPTRVIYLTPQGRVFNQEMAKELATEENLIFLCGHYEGIDERVLEEIVTDEISIGDYVLTGGELPSLVIMDAVSRLIPGVLNNDVSAEMETFYDNLLEYPQYTRPEEFHNKKVPEVLLSGHHSNIEKWRREMSINRTIEKRPDLLQKANLSEKEKIYCKTKRSMLK